MKRLIFVALFLPGASAQNMTNTSNSSSNSTITTVENRTEDTLLPSLPPTWSPATGAHDANISAHDMSSGDEKGDVFLESDRVVVTDQAMGARCAIAADFDGDGRMDIVSASSTDNAVSWFRNEGNNESISFSIKNKITWSSLGSRIVTVADIDGDGDVDVVGASYYDSSLRWFENNGTGHFTEHTISSAVDECQGVTVADLDNDGDNDIATASSGDNTIAVFYNIDRGVFCEIKEVVDDSAIGARTVVASDLNGDGWIDLAAASKDDNSVSWYPNDGTGGFPTKILISRGNESLGAYSLVAVDIDDDGDNDLVVASNGNNHVSLWRNDGEGNFNKTLVFDDAEFVLSVTAVDFDRDGYIDIASASFFDGYIRWHRNVDGKGYEWQNFTVYKGLQGHYVSHADLDGDGDDDLIAVTHAENTVAVFPARTECGLDEECCHVGTEWNGIECKQCEQGEYGVILSNDPKSARCEACPKDTCNVPGETVIPATCSGISRNVDCDNVEDSIKNCSCPENRQKNPETDTCDECPDGQIREDKDDLSRSMDTLGNYSLWEEQQGQCEVKQPDDVLNQIDLAGLIFGLALMFISLGLSLGFAGWTYYYRDERVVKASQPFFLIMLCVGTGFISLSIYPFGIDDKFYSKRACNIACMTGPWLLCIGFTIAFSAIFSKIWRINRVFRSQFRKVKITKNDVLKPFAVLFSLNILILVFWTVMDPLVWKRQPVKEGEEWITYGSCESTGIVTKVCMGLLVFIVLAILVFSCYQAYLSRTISDEYSESQNIGFVIICWLQLLLVGTPLIALLRKNPTPSYFLKSVLISLVSMSLLLLLFIPKIILKKKSSRYGRRRNLKWTVSGLDYMNRSNRSHSSMSFSSSRDASASLGIGIKITSPEMEISHLRRQVEILRNQLDDLRDQEKSPEEKLPKMPTEEQNISLLADPIDDCNAELDDSDGSNAELDERDDNSAASDNSDNNSVKSFEIDIISAPISVIDDNGLSNNENNESGKGDAKQKEVISNFCSSF